MNRICEMRMVACPLGCGVRLRFKDVGIHSSDECVRRFSSSSSSLAATKKLSRSLSRISMSSRIDSSRPSTAASEALP